MSTANQPFSAASRKPRIERPSTFPPTTESEPVRAGTRRHCKTQEKKKPPEERFRGPDVQAVGPDDRNQMLPSISFTTAISSFNSFTERAMRSLAKALSS